MRWCSITAIWFDARIVNSKRGGTRGVTIDVIVGIDVVEDIFIKVELVVRVSVIGRRYVWLEVCEFLTSNGTMTGPFIRVRCWRCEEVHGRNKFESLQLVQCLF